MCILEKFHNVRMIVRGENVLYVAEGASSGEL